MDKKSRLRAGLSFGIFMSVCVFVQNLLTHDNLTAKDIIASLIISIATGTLVTILYLWLMDRVLKSKLITQATNMDTAAGEIILFQTPANHFKGIEGVGGKLFLTNKRLVFISHKLNVQNHQLSIDLSDIDKVNRYRTLGIVNNGLVVMTTDNKLEKFVVQQIDKWINQLTEQNGLPTMHLQ